MNKFDLSKEVKLSFEPGLLIPTLVTEILPGDVIKMNSEVFLRTAPMITPVMHKLDIRTYNFFVPTRLLWDKAEEFFAKGAYSTVDDVPKIMINQDTRSLFEIGSLADYFGIPHVHVSTVIGDHPISALPFRAYNMIFDEYFRNQETDEPLTIVTDSNDVTTLVGMEAQSLGYLRLRQWDKDYFTSGKKSLNLNASVNGYALVEPTADGVTDLYKQQAKVYKIDGSLNDTQTALTSYTNGGVYDSGITRWLGIRNLNDPLGVDIDSIRKASALQRWMERIIRTGYKYIDQLKSIWGVDTSDMRFQRPEYLGGMQQAIRVSSIANTSDTNNAPQGNLSGNGISSDRSGIIQFKSEEHGYLMQLICVVPEANYSQGIPALFSKFDALDFANPMLADLGGQELPIRELYWNYDSAYTNSDENFAYKPRYSEYKSQLNTIHGEFRTDLAFWHFGRKFNTKPQLNSTFVSCYPTTLPWAVSTGHHLYAQIQHNISALRNLPYYSNPEIK